MKKTIKNLLLVLVIISQIFCILFVAFKYFLPPVKYFDNIFLEKCENLTEKDSDILNNFFLYTNYNWDSKYWCKIKRIDNYVLNDNRIIPKEIWKLVNLKELNLNSKNLIWELPKEIWSLKKLERLNISNNNLTWKLPKEIWNLENLKYFYLSWNEFNWNFPAEISNLKKLEYLDLSRNKFSWEFPNKILNLKNIYVLLLSKNNFTWNVPDDIVIEKKCILFICW